MTMCSRLNYQSIIDAMEPDATVIRAPVSNPGHIEVGRIPRIDAD